MGNRVGGSVRRFLFQYGLDIQIPFPQEVFVEGALMIYPLYPHPPTKSLINFFRSLPGVMFVMKHH